MRFPDYYIDNIPVFIETSQPEMLSWIILSKTTFTLEENHIDEE